MGRHSGRLALAELFEAARREMLDQRGHRPGRPAESGAGLPADRVALDIDPGQPRNRRGVRSAATCRDRAIAQTTQPIHRRGRDPVPWRDEGRKQVRHAGGGKAPPSLTQVVELAFDPPVLSEFRGWRGIGLVVPVGEPMLHDVKIGLAPAPLRDSGPGTRGYDGKVEGDRMAAGQCKLAVKRGGRRFGIVVTPPEGRPLSGLVPAVQFALEVAPPLHEAIVPRSASTLQPLRAPSRTKEKAPAECIGGGLDI